MLLPHFFYRDHILNKDVFISFLSFSNFFDWGWRSCKYIKDSSFHKYKLSSRRPCCLLRLRRRSNPCCKEKRLEKHENMILSGHDLAPFKGSKIHHTLESFVSNINLNEDALVHAKRLSCFSSTFMNIGYSKALVLMDPGECYFI